MRGYEGGAVTLLGMGHKGDPKEILGKMVNKGDIFSSLKNVVLVAKVNKNYLSQSGLQRSGLTDSSILNH